MILMKLNKYNIKFLAGSKDSSILSALPFGIYDDDIINFLSELSSQILTISKLKTSKNKTYIASKTPSSSGIQK